MAKRHTYQQVPVIREDRICPVCHAKIESTFQHFVRLYRGDEVLQRELELLQCKNCGIPFIDKVLLTKIQKAYPGYMIDFLKIGEFESADSVLNRIHKRKAEKGVRIVRKKENEILFYVDGRFRVVEKMSEMLGKCPVCNSELVDNFTFIPTRMKEIYTEVEGKRCLFCKSLYISERQGKQVSSILKNLPELQGIYRIEENWREKKVIIPEQQGVPNLNDENTSDEKVTADIEKKEIVSDIPAEMSEHTEILEERNTMAQISSAAMMLIVKYGGYTERKYIICMKKQDVDEKQRIFHYTSEVARELLTILYRPEKKRKEIYKGMELELVREVYPFDSNGQPFRKNVPVVLKIQSGGGLYSSLVRSNKELVDLLLYSPFTKRYEIIRATYDFGREVCYTDVSLFRDFIYKYGRPGVYIEWNDGNGAGRDWDELNSESILKIYGYSVSAREGMSAAERQVLLAELVDLEFMTVSHIVHMLDFFIQSHKSQRYLSAQRKWQQDRKFISEYKVNPQRFLIAK